MGIPYIISTVCHMALGEAKGEDSLSVFCIPLVIVVVVVELAVGEEEGETGSGRFVVLIVGLVYDYVYIIICSIAYLITYLFRSNMQYFYPRCITISLRVDDFPSISQQN